MIIIIVILGWNEFISVMSWILGPLLIPILLLLGGIGYLLYAGQMGGPTMRLISSVAGPTLNQIWNQVLSVFDMVGQGRNPQPRREDHTKSD